MGQSSVEPGIRPIDGRELRGSALQSVVFEIVGFAAVLAIVVVTVGLRAFELSAKRNRVQPPDRTSTVARMDTDSTRRGHGAATSTSTQKSTRTTTEGGEVRLSQDSLARQRDPAAQAPKAPKDSAKKPTAPPPSAVVP
jgi:hypothetical protein